tara:strand:+ start:470 stop:769 length:300 start_codon:yes stop_codon:yes gene_type:complete
MDLIYKKILEITNKWYNEHRHGHFIVFKDGDIFNESNKNIEYIEIKLAFEGRKKFNWTEGLLKDEIVFVNNNWDYFREYFRKREVNNSIRKKTHFLKFQ